MPEDEHAPAPHRPFRVATLLVYAVLALGCVYLVRLTARQAALVKAVEALAANPQDASEVLGHQGPAAFKHLATALHHDRNRRVRLLAGQILLKGLLRALQEHISLHPDDEPDSPSHTALEKAKRIARLLAEAKPKENWEEQGLARLMAYLDEGTTGAMGWQKRTRKQIGTDNVSLALWDVSRDVRELAGAVFDVTGPNNALDIERIQRRREVEGALAKAAEPDKARLAEARAELMTIGHFSLAPMIGAIASSAATDQTRAFLASLVAEIVRKDFSHNVRAKVTSLLGRQASALMTMTMLRAQVGLKQQLMAIFTASPKVSKANIEELTTRFASSSASDAAEGIVEGIARLEGD